MTEKEVIELNEWLQAKGQTMSIEDLVIMLKSSNELEGKFSNIFLTKFIFSHETLTPCKKEQPLIKISRNAPEHTGVHRPSAVRTGQEFCIKGCHRHFQRFIA